MGQRNVLAAYPFHFHLLGDAYSSYIQDCSVYRSFYRGVVLHGTSHSTISNNVAFDVSGNCFYMEDGVEEHNLIHRNLAAYIHVIGKPAAGSGQGGSTHVQSSSLRQPADAAAAGFWITNLRNTITNNAASGGWTGFSIPRLDKPVGLHRSMTGFSPHKRPTKVFSGNTAHSSGYMWQRGACIYVGGKLWHQASDSGRMYYNSGRLERDTRNPKDGSSAWTVFNSTKVAI